MPVPAQNPDPEQLRELLSSSGPGGVMSLSVCPLEPLRALRHGGPGCSQRPHPGWQEGSGCTLGSERDSQLGTGVSVRAACSVTGPAGTANTTHTPGEAIES